MEKVLNINFQGRVIPIEETAYNNLKQYIEDLTRHFANEESRDEIINDIENRIAELLSERVKRGALCITMADLNAVIDSIGRLEDIEAAEGEEIKSGQKAYTSLAGDSMLRDRFYRNADDKVIAGVCSGIAARVGIDPLVVRILFVLLSGALLWIYILLWIVVPSQSLRYNVTRRLFRDPNNKVIAGVCGGLAAYFRVATWIPRVVFGVPVLIGALWGGIRATMWHWPGDWGWGPHAFSGSIGSSLFILYIVLWIALPYASSSTEKLEMRGEKVDINTIKSTTQANAGAAPAHTGGGIGRTIGILFKAFFLFIAGVMALSLFGVLIGLIATSFMSFPLMNFMLDSWGQNVLVWVGVILLLGIPMLALITWIVRRLMGVRSHRHYLGYVFSGLWIVGLVTVLIFTGMVAKDFNSGSHSEDTFPVQQTSSATVYFQATDFGGRNTWPRGSHYTWFNDWDDDDTPPFFLVGKDSLWLRSVRLSVRQSPDSLCHIYIRKSSRGANPDDAARLSDHITYTISQQDSMISLPAGFTISSADKFRNQEVTVIAEVPVGKQVKFSREMDRHFNIDFNRSHYWHSRRYRLYRMTSGGVEKVKDDQEKWQEEEKENDNDD